MQEYRLEKLLENNNSCIIDSCLCHNYKSKLEYYKRLGIKYYIIRLECSSEIVKNRLEKRTISNENYSIANYDDYLWMKDNAYKYGFIMRYPEDKEDITGYMFESWHYRYVGKEVATYIYENGITFDEYYAYFLAHN